MGQTPSRNRPSYSSISDGNKEKTGRHRPKHHHATTANPSQPRPIQSQPERTTKVVPVRSTRNSSSPYLELQSERTTEVVPARFELEASEPVHPTLCEGIIPFVMSFSRSSLPPPSFSFKEEIPIPTTIVEKVPDGESPVYGDTGIESFHEDEQACQAYAEPDEMDSEAPSPPPLPPRPTPSEPPSSASSTTLYSSSCTCSMTTSPTSSFSSSSAPPSHKELILRTREHGIGFLCFNWDYSSSTKRTAQGILNARRTSADSMNVLELFKLARIHDVGKARLVWNLLSPTSNILTPTQCRIDFYQAFVHLNQGSQKELPHHVPIGIRAKFHCDPCSARLKYLSISKGKQELSNDDMKKINSWIYGPSNDHIQGQRLVTMLECALEDGGPILALTYLNVLMKQPHPHRKIDGLTGLTHVCEEQLSNMLATYVRSFRVRMSNWSEVKIYENIDFLSKVLMISERTPSIWANEASRFKRTIGKLEGVEVSLCLWLFISSWRCRNVYEVSALFDIMRDHYAQTFPEGVQLYHLHLAGKPENEVVINVVAFLCSVTEKRRLSPFFSDLYNAMVQCIGAHSFLQAWEAMHESDLYERQIDLLYERQKCERLMGETAEEFMRIIHSSDES